jgi:predicted transcriptional regulator
MTPPYGYTEDALIEQPAIALLAALGWQTVNAYHEFDHGASILGRETKDEVVLKSRLRETEVAMLHKLFSSKVRIALLNTFFLHPEKTFYLRELERITGEDYKNVSTELKNLESIGLLTSSKSGNLKYFHVNPEFLIYPELKSIFFKVRGAPGLLKQVLSDSPDMCDIYDGAKTNSGMITSHLSQLT